MKRVFILYSILFFTVAYISEAEPSTSLRALNGNDWNKWDNDKKIVFISGFMCGTDWFAINSLFPDSLFPGETARQRAETIWNDVTNEVSQAAADPKTISTNKYNSIDVFLYSLFDAYKKNDRYNKAIIKLSSVAIVQGLNQFYLDRDNVKVLLSNAVYVVRKKLKGAPAEDIKVLLPYLRGEKAIPPGWIVPVYDEKGNFVKIVEFP